MAAPEREPLAVARPLCPNPPPGPFDEGIALIASGRPDRALERLRTMQHARPGSVAADALARLSADELERANARAAKAAESVPLVPLERLPLAAVRGPAAPGGAKAHLDKKSEAKNLIVDQADWLEKNGLLPREGRGGDGTPAHVGRAYKGARLRSVFRSPDHDIASYGPVLVVFAEGKRPLALDARAPIASGPRAFDVVFAQLAGNLLVLQLAYNGYARESKGRNGYVAAYDAATGRLVWSSDPLTGNLANFGVYGGSVIAGYGFTAEPDFLSVLDLATGAVDQKIPLKTGPEQILDKNGELFVRTYNTDYVFRSGTGLPPAPAAALSDAGSERGGLDAETTCWLRAATAAVERRDDAGLAEALRGLQAAGLSTAPFEQGRRAPGKLDLSSPPPIVVSEPPWHYALVTPGPLPAGPAPKLRRVSGERADPVRTLAKRAFSPPRASGIAPIDDGRLPAGAPPEIPSSYGVETLRAIIPAGERLLLVYGGRYLVSVSAGAVERIFDLDALRHPPDPNPQWKEFASQDVTYAQIADGTLYVCNGGGSYAREVHGKKGFITAIDSSTGRIRWRSDPLVCGAPFVMVGEAIVSGYGFTDEPDYVFLIRRADGKVLERLPVESAPEELYPLDAQRIRVESYGHRYVIEVAK
jgi:outer membrane protein assembly factor BamB